MIRAGFQIPSFTYPGVGPEELFEAVAAMAVTAESAGFDSVLVMDHFYQLPLLGPPEHEMLEAYTLLGALAARTRTAKLGTLVTGVTYRNPAVLAKIVTTLDVVSQGRAFLGIGAAWFDVEHEGLGVDFPPVRERFERLDEAVRICRAMFRAERPTFEGTHYRTRDAINSPLPVTPGGPPVMIGGQGERRTLRLMAEHADVANLSSSLPELPRKLEVLAAHCEDVGRDAATLHTTQLASMVLGRTMEEAEAKRSALLQARGLPPWDELDDQVKALVGGRLVVGDPDTAGEQLRSLLDLGLGGFTVNLPADGCDTDAVALAGELMRAVFA